MSGSSYAGGKVFCAGADIMSARSSRVSGEYGKLNRLVREVFYSIMERSNPYRRGQRRGARQVLRCQVL
jgi:enoyl-CoA hydratase/carnithine racemase